MKKLICLLVIGGLFVSCAGLPQLHRGPEPESAEMRRACLGFYPAGRWQLLHTIQAELPGGQKGFLMGVTRLSSRERSARAVMMTPEGFVVFDAHDDGTVRVGRAVAPFDNEAFAKGVMTDIRLIFFKPLADEITAGASAAGAAVCRYLRADGHVIDVVQLEKNHWETRLYHTNHRMKRLVKSMLSENPTDGNPWGLADKIELTALGTPAYKLILNLVEAIPLEAE